MLSSLHFTSDPDFSKPLGEDWIEMKTEAIGLNTKINHPITSRDLEIYMLTLTVTRILLWPQHGLT